MNKEQIEQKLAEISRANPKEDFQWDTSDYHKHIIYAWAKTYWTVEMIHEWFNSVGLLVKNVGYKGGDAVITFQEMDTP